MGFIISKVFIEACASPQKKITMAAKFSKFAFRQV